MRKLWFAHLAQALVVFPGGFGTFDELFEILTLAQTRKLDRTIPVLLYGTDYWREVVNFDALVRHGTIAAEDLSCSSSSTSRGPPSSCSRSASTWSTRPTPSRHLPARAAARYASAAVHRTAALAPPRVAGGGVPPP